MNLILKISAFFTTIIGIFLTGRYIGNKDKDNIKNENINLKNDLEINKKISGMSFSDKSDFLLSKQKNRNKK